MLIPKSPSRCHLLDGPRSLFLRRLTDKVEAGVYMIPGLSLCQGGNMPALRDPKSGLLFIASALGRSRPSLA